MPSKKQLKAKSFEEQLDEVNRISQSIDEGKLSLDDTVSAYEKGMQIIQELESMLSSYEKRIEQINPETMEISEFAEDSHEV